MSDPTLQPQLFTPSFNTNDTSSPLPRIFNFTLRDVKPCFYPNELRKIDGFLKLIKKNPQESAKPLIQLSSENDDDSSSAEDPYPLNYRTIQARTYYSHPSIGICLNCETAKEAWNLNVCELLFF